MFNVGDKVVWAEGARKGRVVDTHADGRLLEIETDNGDLFYKGYEDVDHVELSYDELKAAYDDLKDEVHDLTVAKDQFKGWYDKAAVKCIEQVETISKLTEERDSLASRVHDLQREIDELQLDNLHNTHPAPGSGLIAVIVDKDGDPWQYDGTDEYGQDVYTMSGHRSSDIEYGRKSFRVIEELYGVRETRGKR